MNLFDTPVSDEKSAETIEPEVISVKGYTKERKPKATYDEIFADLPTREVVVGTLTEEEKQCPICGTQMIPIGHEVIRTESIYTEPKLEHIRCIATTYKESKFGRFGSYKVERISTIADM